MSNAYELEPEIKVLRAKARDSLTEDWITKHDKINGDGDKIDEVRYRRGDNTYDVNLSHLFGPSPSTTGDVDLLVLEAEMQADGKELRNPHVPIDTDVLAQAVERITEAGHSPAWEQ